MTSLFQFRHLRGMLLALAVGVFLALTGAFDTLGISLAGRLFYWLLQMGIGGAVGVGISIFIERAAWMEDKPLRQGALIVLLLATPLVFVVWFLTTVFFGHGDLDWARLPAFILPVFIVTIAMTGLNYLVQREPPQTHAAPPEAAPPRFLDRLPPKLRGSELFAVEAEDHYLRLHTSKGQDLILMRLSDAVAELEGIEGAQTHRSWWVAKAAVTEARRGDGRATMTLRDGSVAPVSRAYAKALREAGWF